VADDKNAQAQDPAEETEENEDPEDSGGDGVTLTGLNAKVDRLADMISNLLKGGGTKASRATKADDAADVAGQVRTEVERLRAEEERERKSSGKLAELEAKVAKITEKVPVEYRRITTLLWGEPDE
jgi:hypothetical protein